MFEKIRPYCLIGFHRIVSIFFILIFLCTIFDNKSSNHYSLPLQLGTLAAFVILSLILGIFARKYKGRITHFLEANERKALFLFFAVLALVQIYLVSCLSTAIGWDVDAVVMTAIHPENAQNPFFQEYFSLYPNNLFLMFCIHGQAQIFGSEDIWLLLSYVNVLSIDLTIFMVFFIVKKNLGCFYAFLAIILSAFLFGLFAWIIVPYSDTLVLPYITGAWLLFQKMTAAETPRKQLGLMIASLCIIFLGYLIKPTAVILLIAFVMVRAIYSLGQKKKFPLLLYLLLLAVGFGSFNQLWKTYKNQQNIIQITEGISVPMTHFIMMGLNQENYGMYLESDVQYTKSFETTQEKSQAALEAAARRLQQMLADGSYPGFLYNKLCRIYCEGDFFWGKEGNFADFNDTNDHWLLKSIYYPAGSHHLIYLYVTQGFWLLTLLLAAGNWNKKMQEDSTLAYCSLVGITLFILIFEMRSRYLIPYLPVFVAAAVFGLKEYCRCLTKITE